MSDTFWCDSCQTHHPTPELTGPHDAPADAPGPASSIMASIPGIINAGTHDPDTGQERTEIPVEPFPVPYLGATLNIPLPITEEVRIIVITNQGYVMSKHANLADADKSYQIWWPNMVSTLIR